VEGRHILICHLVHIYQSDCTLLPYFGFRKPLLKLVLLKSNDLQYFCSKTIYILIKSLLCTL